MALSGSPTLLGVEPDSRRTDLLRRPIKEGIELVNGLKGQGVGPKCLRDGLNTTTPGGTLVFCVFASIVEFERDLILKRTMAGLEAARAQGRKGGRRPMMDERKIALDSKLMGDREVSIPEVCEAVGVSRSTLYRYLTPDGTPRPRR